MRTEAARELVSVIVPAYNAAATLGETLESALAQTYRNLEVIVVDDGSTDATAELVRSVAARDTRVRLLQQANAGVAAARNRAIAHARGAYVAPLDADDLWHREKLALQVAAMRRGGPRVGVVSCWWRVIDTESRVIGEPLLHPHEGDVYTALIIGNVPPNASLPLIRRACLAEVGGYDPDPCIQGCEDLKLCLQLAERYRFALVRQHLVGYRRTPASLASDPRRMLRAHKTVLAEARRRHPELPAWLFRMAEARSEYWQAKSCLHGGLLLAGVVMFAAGFRRDPAALAYRLREKLSQVFSSRVLNRPPSLPRHRPLGGGARANPVGMAAWLRPYRAQARARKPDATPHQAIDVRGQPFAAVAAEPSPGPKFGTALYTRRCEAAAAANSGRRRVGQRA